VAGGNGGNKLGAVERRFTCTRTVFPDDCPDREVAAVDAVAARDVDVVVSVDIDTIRVLDWEVNGGRAVGPRDADGAGGLIGIAVGIVVRDLDVGEI